MTNTKVTCINCEVHGRLKWEGHVICLNCNRLWQTSNENGELYSPDVCTCGRRLMPVESDQCAEFFARSICPKCFDTFKPRKSNSYTVIGDAREIRKLDKEVFSALTSGMFDNFALMPCMVNGEPSVAIVSFHDRDDETSDACPHYVAVTKSMLITDYEGNSPGEDPEDKKTH